MRLVSIVVRADWDAEAKVWVASSNDIEGLAVESATLEQLESKVLAAISDLIELNRIQIDLPEIPVHILAQQLAKLPVPCH